MKLVKPTKQSPSFADLQRKVNELVTENNRKNTEIRQIKSKLRVNAHFKRA